MTDKQKEAIENVKEQLEGIKKANECGLATRGEFNKDIEAIETVLNLLEEKEQLYHKALGDLVISDKENIKKDKIIDYIIEWIRERSIYAVDSHEKLKEHFEKKVEEKSKK